MRRRTREALRRLARKHGLFAGVAGLLALLILLALMFSPAMENSRWSWSLPQVRDGD